MKRTLLFLFLATLCTAGVDAQTQVKTQKQLHLPESQTAAANPHTAGKTTATDSRLRATAYYYFDNGSLGIVDSTDFTYNPGMGYDFVLDEWKYKDTKSWDENGDPSYRSSQTFDSKNHVASTLFESYDGAAWLPESFISRKYNLAQLEASSLDAYFDGSGWDSTRNSYTYNSQGKLLIQHEEDYNTGTSIWESRMYVGNSYDANGLLDTSETSFYNPSTTFWEPSHRTINTYNSNKELITTLSEGYISGNWMPSGKQSFTYVNGNVTVELTQQWNGSAYLDQERRTNTYSGNDKLTDTYEQYIGGNWTNNSQNSYAYNTYHQTTVETSKTWNGISGQFEFSTGGHEMYYYYEEFANSVKDVNAKNGSMKVYPVPARDELMLKTSFATAQSGIVTLFDMSGRMVKQMSLPTTTQHSQRIDVANLPAGNYTMQLNAGGTNLVERVSIVK